MHPQIACNHPLALSPLLHSLSIHLENELIGLKTVKPGWERRVRK
jgi:hypothetical protein